MTASRRAVLGALAVTPAVIVAPALSSSTEPNRHAAWLEERNRLMDWANEASIGDDELNRRTGIVVDAENRILNTPSRNAAEAKTKLRLVASLHAEGSCLSTYQAADVFDDLARWLA